MVLSVLKRNLAVAVVGVSVVAGGAAAWANGSSGDPTVDTSTPAAVTATAPGAQRPQGARGEHAARRPGAALMRHAVHGDLVVRNPKTKEFENVSFDRGKLASHDGDRITIDRPDGKTVTVQLREDTRYRGVSSADQLVVGQPVLTVHKGANAVLVAQRPASD